MRTFTFYFRCVSLLFVVSSLPSTLAIDTCVNHPTVKINLRKREDANGRESNVGAKQCTPGVYYDPWSKDNAPKITAKTKIPEDGQVVLKSSATTGEEYICDHLLELQQVKAVMEQAGGACEKAAEFAAANSPAAAIEKLRKIRWHTWQPNNLFFVEKSVENRKGKTVKDGVSVMNGMSWHKANEVRSLLFKNSGPKAVFTAGAIDLEIEEQFPGAKTGVKAAWLAYLGQVKTIWGKKKSKAEDDLCKEKAKEARAGGGGGGSGKFTRRAATLPARMLRRHLSGMVAFDTAPSTSAFAPVGISSLVERARKGAARSGPHAPPGRSCPMQKQPQKKVVPRKDVKTAPPPATKPRQPAQRPAPRPVNAKKQVAKRPASRARRDVGKPRVQKRATPRQKPKVIPKPTRRPRGKPRQRRRRR